MKGKFRDAADRHDIYTRVTNKIVAALENGVRPWRQPWETGDTGQILRPLRHNGQPYSGVNVLILWISSVQSGYM